MPIDLTSFADVATMTAALALVVVVFMGLLFLGNKLVTAINEERIEDYFYLKDVEITEKAKEDALSKGFGQSSRKKP